MMESVSSHVIRAIQLSYTGRHVSQRILQLWRVINSRDRHRYIRWIFFVLLDMCMGLCLAHVLRQLFLTPQRSIGMYFHRAFKNYQRSLLN